jgi:hypothetical protein
MQARPHHSTILTRTLVALIFPITIFSCQRELKMDKLEDLDHNVVLNFKPVVQYDSVDMKFDTVYKNFFSEPFSVKAFKFYIHGIELINTDSNKVFRIANDKYYLIDFSDSTSTQVKLGVLPYKYNRIAFIMGVDSLFNVSGAQTDALDPAKGMFWEWNSGYIMAKLEGTSPSSSAPSHIFQYHIGGFKQSESVIKRITLLFPFGENVDMQPGKATEINVTADVYDWFNNPHDIKISATPAIMTPGTLAQQVAENYSKMFTVTEIVND